MAQMKCKIMPNKIKQDLRFLRANSIWLSGHLTNLRPSHWRSDCRCFSGGDLSHSLNYASDIPHRHTLALHDCLARGKKVGYHIDI